MKRKTRVIGIVAAVAATMIAPAALAYTAMADPADDLDWKPCPDAEGEVLCATVAVPLDYENPDGETIEIGLAKRPALNPDERVGSLLVDPGGPGGSGVDMIAGSPIGSKELQEKFDIVGFDPRGINTSTPIQCDEADLDAVMELGNPTDDESFAAIAAANEKLADGCRELTGPLFDHADNLHTVEDIERVRQALGGEKLNFLGYSYGTLMGQQYAEKYPENIRTMVMDGNMDHSLEGATEFALTETAAVERNFNSFAAWCDETAECALNEQGTEAAYAQLREAARAGELTDPDTGDPIDFYGLAERTSSVNFPSAWPDTAEYFEAMLDGTRHDAPKTKAAAEPIEFVMQSMFCSDWDIKVDSFDEWTRIADRLAEENPNTQWSSYVDHLSTCIGDAVETTNPQSELDIEGAPPLVMIGNLNDFATVYEWSEVAAEQSGAILMTYEGYGHTIYGGGNECVDGPVEAYFIDGTAPDEGISCENQDEPGGESDKHTADAPVAGPFARN